MSNTRESKVPTPTLDKMRSVKADSQKIGTFIDWLGENGMSICAEVSDPRYGSSLEPITESVEKLLARYFEIDLGKVEEERMALLDEIRGDQ
jgi:hypothetical protein